MRGRVYGWYEGRLFAQEATAFEIAMVEYIERVQSDMAELRCVAWGIRTCEDCGNAMCPFKVGTRGVPQQPKETQSMPSKKDLQAAKKAGVNPYAVAQAAVNKGKITPSQKEGLVKDVTKSVLRKKRGGCKKGK